MLRIAVPNKGTLSGPAAQMLREAGYRQRADDRDLVCRDAAHDVEFFYLRPRDIATYVGSGELDLGITGRDLLIDAQAPAEELVDLDFGGATFRFAVRPTTGSSPAGSTGPGAGPDAASGHAASPEPGGPTPSGAAVVTTVPAGLVGRRIATAYPGVVAGYLTEHGIDAAVIRLDGAVENAVRLGVADVIADVVSTGGTLRQAGLVPVGEPLLVSSAVLIRRVGAPTVGPVDQVVRRLQGVLVARRYVMLAYDVRADLLDRATALTPGIESPTISPLHREGWVAVQAMVLRAEVHRIMDELYDVGARAILVTDIHACRL